MQKHLGLLRKKNPNIYQQPELAQMEIFVQRGIKIGRKGEQKQRKIIIDACLLRLQNIFQWSEIPMSFRMMADQRACACLQKRREEKQGLLKYVLQEEALIEVEETRVSYLSLIKPLQEKIG